MDKSEHNSPETLLLRNVEDADIAIFFQHQLDPAANQMAAFTSKDPSNREAFVAHWIKIRSDENVMIRTILLAGHVAGHVASYGPSNEKEVTYWIGKEYWGKGIATRALSLFLDQMKTRPLMARVAHDNIASIRVLEKCGFAICGKDRYFANARGEEIEEIILKLD